MSSTLSKQPNGVELSEDDIAQMRFRKALARKKRKEREAEGEIKELNITAMMDMMTIILVFLIKSYSASSVTVTASDDVRPPTSSTRVVPKDTVAITVTRKAIFVNDKKRVELKNMDVAPEQMVQGQLIGPLNAALELEVKKLKFIAQQNPAAPFTQEVSIIGDGRIPFRLLNAVLYTAGRNELGKFRLVVLSKGE
jgi:biopolymer transport protein ExbD